MSLPKGMLGDRSRQPLTHSVDMPLVIVGDVPDASADLAQPLGRLVFSLLEPRPDDGFTNWNVLDPALEGIEIYPIRRR